MDDCELFQQHDDAKTHKLKTFGPSLHCNVMNVHIQNHNTFTHVSSSLAYTRHMHKKREHYWMLKTLVSKRLFTLY